MSYLNGFFDPFPFFLLLSTAAAFVVMGSWLHLEVLCDRVQPGPGGRHPRGIPVQIEVDWRASLADSRSETGYWWPRRSGSSSGIPPSGPS